MAREDENHFYGRTIPLICSHIETYVPESGSFVEWTAHFLLLPSLRFYELFRHSSLSLQTFSCLQWRLLFLTKLKWFFPAIVVGHFVSAGGKRSKWNAPWLTRHSGTEQRGRLPWNWVQNAAHVVLVPQVINWDRPEMNGAPEWNDIP